MSDWSDTDSSRDSTRPEPKGFGGDWRGSRVSFDNPMSWSLRLFRVAGITVRLHLFFFVFVLAVLGRAASSGAEFSFGVGPAALGLLALFTVILLHEFGHCFACRCNAGTADEILLWPLGGLATCNPPDRPRAHLWTAIGGPLVNVAIIMVLTPLIGFRTGQWFGLAIPNPLSLTSLVQRPDFDSWWAMLLVMTNSIAWTLLLFNLLPMFPLDGGRILQASLWPRMGYARSMKFACRAGLVGAAVLAALGLVMESTMLLAIAVFGGFVCYMTAKQLEQQPDYLGVDLDAGDLAAMEESLAQEKREVQEKQAVQAKIAKGQQSREAELDAILSKIAARGIDSLSRAVRDALQRATDEKRDRLR